MGYSRARELIHEKTLKSKTLCQTPFKMEVPTMSTKHTVLYCNFTMLKTYVIFTRGCTVQKVTSFKG
jgi:hypothetical protein